MKKLLVNVFAALFARGRKKRHVLRESLLNKFVPIEGFLDAGGIDWATYMLTHNMPEMVADLRKGLDAESNRLLDIVLQRIRIFPKGGIYRINETFMRTSILQTPEEKEAEKRYLREFPRYRREFLLDEEERNVDTFLYHSGLADKNEKLKKYIDNKDFIDGGAYIGDTAMLYIKKYNPRKVYSFEISARTRMRYEKVMRKNNIPADKYECVPIGLFDRKSEIAMDDSGHQGTSILESGNDKVRLTDLDSFAEEKNIKTGFIKADLEGSGLEGVRGMTKTIRRDRPVLCLSIYHNPREFFEIKPALDEITKDLNYKIMLEKHYPFPDRMIEVVVFAYPGELGE